jgi:hypothetical protein
MLIVPLNSTPLRHAAPRWGASALQNAWPHPQNAPHFGMSAPQPSFLRRIAPWFFTVVAAAAAGGGGAYWLQQGKNNELAAQLATQADQLATQTKAYNTVSCDFTQQITADLAVADSSNAYNVAIYGIGKLEGDANKALAVIYALDDPNATTYTDHMLSDYIHGLDPHAAPARALQKLIAWRNGHDQPPGEYAGRPYKTLEEYQEALIFGLQQLANCGLEVYSH